MYLLVICEILRLLVKTLTADGKSSLGNKETVQQHIQMQLWKKQILYSQFRPQFRKSKSIFEYFQKQSKNQIPFSNMFD